jgi:Ion transport protein
VRSWPQIQYGYFMFDNIGAAALQIFRVIVIEGWTGVMYTYMDSSGFIAAIFFPMIVIVGSFFMLQLFLAVIMETFSDTSKKLQKEHEMILLTQKKESQGRSLLLEKGLAKVLRGAIKAIGNNPTEPLGEQQALAKRRSSQFQDAAMFFFDMQTIIKLKEEKDARDKAQIARINEEQAQAVKEKEKYSKYSVKEVLAEKLGLEVIKLDEEP